MAQAFGEAEIAGDKLALYPEVYHIRGFVIGEAVVAPRSGWAGYHPSGLVGKWVGLVRGVAG